MDYKVRIVVFLISLLWLLFVLRLVRNRRIWEKYAIFWVYLGIAVVILPLFMDVFDWILYKLGVDHPPNFLFLLGFLGVLLVLLQTTVEMTTLGRQSRNAIQDIAILEGRIHQLESDLAALRSRSGAEDSDDNGNEKHP